MHPGRLGKGCVSRSDRALWNSTIPLHRNDKGEGETRESHHITPGPLKPAGRGSEAEQTTHGLPSSVGSTHSGLEVDKTFIFVLFLFFLSQHSHHMWCLFPGKANPRSLWTDIVLCLTIRAGSPYTAALSRWPRMEATRTQNSNDLY